MDSGRHWGSVILKSLDADRNALHMHWYLSMLGILRHFPVTDESLDPISAVLDRYFAISIVQAWLGSPYHCYSPAIQRIKFSLEDIAFS